MKFPFNRQVRFIGAEITIKAMLKGYRVGEVGIQTFPPRFWQRRISIFNKYLENDKRYDLKYMVRYFLQIMIYQKTDQDFDN